MDFCSGFEVGNWWVDRRDGDLKLLIIIQVMLTRVSKKQAMPSKSWCPTLVLIQFILKLLWAYAHAVLII